MAQHVFNWGPIVALALIATIFYSVIQTHPVIYRGSSPFVAQMTFSLWLFDVCIILYSFFRAIYVGPGNIKLKWQPKNEDDRIKLAYCHKCEGYKPPRCHHCSECGRCVKILDHHCPWINGCVGNDNRIYFLVFVTSVPIGCAYSAYVNVAFLVKYYHTLFSPQMAHVLGYRLSLNMFMIALLGAALAAAVSLGVALLAGIQIRNIIKNISDIERWSMDTANSRKREDKFVFPFDLGWKSNLRQTFLQSRRKDGLSWPVKPGTTPFDISKEVLQYRYLVSLHRHTFKVIKTPTTSFSFASLKRRLFNFNKRQLAVKEGDVVQCWREKSGQSFGEKVYLEDSMYRPVYPRLRGWMDSTILQPHTHYPFDYRGDGLLVTYPDDSVEGLVCDPAEVAASMHATMAEQSRAKGASEASPDGTTATADAPLSHGAKKRKGTRGKK